MSCFCCRLRPIKGGNPHRYAAGGISMGVTPFDRLLGLLHERPVAPREGKKGAGNGVVHVGANVPTRGS